MSRMGGEVVVEMRWESCRKEKEKGNKQGELGSCLRIGWVESSL